MECQNTIKNLKVNKNKSIGEIVVVVEGESEEFKLLKHIFVDLFDYNYIPYKKSRGITDIMQSKTNKNSTVFVVNTNSSSMKSLLEPEDFKDNLYNLIMKDYQRSLKNVPIYILWDRDHKSNTKKTVLKCLDVYRNSQDNNYNMYGLLLLSYPCVESYELSHFNKQAYLMKFRSSLEVKKEVRANARKYSLANITEKSLLVAAQNMHKSFENMKIYSYEPSDFYKVNKKVFEMEESFLKTDGYYKALSLITVMLVDLGIINV